MGGGVYMIIQSESLAKFIGCLAIHREKAANQWPWQFDIDSWDTYRLILTSSFLLIKNIRFLKRKEEE